MAKKTSDKLTKMNKETLKPLKVRFCPSCKGTDVGFVFRLQNLFGLLPRVECTSCGHSSVEFPLLVVNDKDKAFAKSSSKKKKAGKKPSTKKKTTGKKTSRRKK